GDIIRSPGNVTVAATGSTTLVQTGGNNGGPSGIPAIGGGLVTTVSAGLDLLIGAAGSIGDVGGGQSVVLNAGRDLILNGGSMVDAIAGGPVSANASRNITLTTS